MSSATIKKRIGPDLRAVTKEIRRQREEVEDLLDTLDLLEARARNPGKPRIQHAVIMEKYGVK